LRIDDAVQCDRVFFSVTVAADITGTLEAGTSIDPFETANATDVTVITAKVNVDPPFNCKKPFATAVKQ
jgi:hypothetical protein